MPDEAAVNSETSGRTFGAMQEREGLIVQEDGFGDLQVNNPVSAYSPEIRRFRIGHGNQWLLSAQHLNGSRRTYLFLARQGKIMNGQMRSVWQASIYQVPSGSDPVEDREYHAGGKNQLVELDSLTPEEVRILSRSGVLGAAIAATNPLSGEIEARQDPRDGYYLAERRQYEHEVKELRVLLMEIRGRKERLEGLSVGEAMALNEARTLEGEVRARMKLYGRGSFRWQVVQNAWFWEGDPLPIGIVDDLTDEDLFNNQQLGAVYVVKSGSSPIILFKQNIERQSSLIRSAPVVVEDQVNQSDWLLGILSGGEERVETFFRGVVKARAVRAGLNPTREIAYNVLIHEWLHEHHKRLGDEPAIEDYGRSNRVHHLAFEVASYLSEFSSPEIDLPFTVLQSLSSRIWLIADTKGKGGRFWRELTKDTNPSLNARLVALEYVLNEAGGWSFEDDWEGLEKLVRRLLTMDKETIARVGRKATEAVRRYRNFSPEEKDQWLREVVTFDLENYLGESKVV